MSSDKKGTFLGDQNPAQDHQTVCKVKRHGHRLQLVYFRNLGNSSPRQDLHIGSPISAIINSRALFSPFPDLVLITTACNLGLWTARGNELPSCVKPPKNCSKSPEKNCSLTIRASVARNSTLASAPKKVFKTCAGKKWRSTLKSAPHK